MIYTIGALGVVVCVWAVFTFLGGNVAEEDARWHQ